MPVLGEVDLCLGGSDRHHIHVIGPADFVQFADEYRAGRHESQPQAGHGVSLGKSAQYGQVFKAPDPWQHRVSGEFGVGLIDQYGHAGEIAEEPFQVGEVDLGSRGIIGVHHYQQPDAGEIGGSECLADGLQRIAHVLAVGGGNEPRLQGARDLVVHGEGGFGQNDGLARLQKCPQHDVDTLVRAIGEDQLRGL